MYSMDPLPQISANFQGPTPNSNLDPNPSNGQCLQPMRGGGGHPGAVLDPDTP